MTEQKVTEGGMSLIQQNKSGSKIEPWDTPDVTDNQLNVAPSCCFHLHFFLLLLNMILNHMIFV